MAIKFSEGFQRGILGATVTRANTGFHEIYNDVDYPADVQIQFTNEAYSGGLAATIPPAVTIAKRIAGEAAWQHQYMRVLGGTNGATTNTITDQAVEMTWFYKYACGPNSFSGRYIFEAYFDVIGNPIIKPHPNGAQYGSFPQTDSATSYMIGIEQAQEPNVWYYDHVNYNDPGLGTTVTQHQVTPPPEDVWLKMVFTWRGAGLPFSMKITSAANETVVYMDITHNASRTNVGLAYWDFFAITHREDVNRTPPADPTFWAGYDFQNWFDGVYVTPLINGQVGGVRRRFVAAH